MAADAGISLGVVVAGIVIMFSGWLLIDPLISLVIAAVILVGTWSLLRDSLNLAIDSVPESIDIAAVRTYLTALENVAQVHDLHVWAMSTTEVALTVHLVMTTEYSDKNFLSTTQQHLHERFGIGHSTIQLERQGDEVCMLNKEA